MAIGSILPKVAMNAYKNKLGEEEKYALLEIGKH